jgi:two-component system, sensor histidine kinase RpfC
MSLILIVDDDRLSAVPLAMFVAALDYEYVVLRNGDAAIGWLGANSYDLVILDLHMPGATGLDVLRATRAMERRPPIVVYSADDVLRDETMSLGASAFAVKGNVDALAALVRRHAHGDEVARRDVIPHGIGTVPAWLCAACAALFSLA